jgi:predicted enzyme related to lactoylglutathione lyase
MNTNPTLRGMSTISYWADDVAAAAAWYSELLGVEPYFAKPDAKNPAYVEFRFGDYQHELGIVSRAYQQGPQTAHPAGVVLYWHVDAIESTLARLVALGAIAHEPITERGDGFVTASVIDPFGNILGIMHNPHYLEILAATK